MPKIDAYSEMSKSERYFLNGMIRYVKPKKILEVGVSAGGSSAIILNAIKDMPESTFCSVDYLDKWYRDPTKDTGFVAKDLFSTSQWKLLTGKDISFFVESIGADIDLMLLDTAHVHPVETLNFLCVLPFLKPGAWVVLHDISLHLLSKKALACKYLFDYVDSESKVAVNPHDMVSWTMKESSTINNLCFSSNIGAFQVSEITRTNISRLLSALTLPWGTEVKARDIEQISYIVHKYYDKETAAMFEDVIKLQIYHKNTLNPFENEGCRTYFRKLCQAIKISVQSRIS